MSETLTSELREAPPRAWEYWVAPYGHHHQAHGVVLRKEEMSDAVPREKIVWRALYGDESNRRAKIGPTGHGRKSEPRGGAKPPLPTCEDCVPDAIANARRDGLLEAARLVREEIDRKYYTGLWRRAIEGLAEKLDRAAAVQINAAPQAPLPIQHMRPVSTPELAGGNEPAGAAPFGAPDRIYLDMEDEGAYWHEFRVDASDIEYVRADLVK